MKPIMAVTILLGACSAAHAMEPQVLAEEQRVRSPDTVELAFDLPAIPAGQQVRLGLEARVDWSDLAGFNPWMIVSVNGKTLLGPDLLNKPVDFTTRNGVDFVWVKGGAWTILYSPDFSDEVRTRIMPWGFPDTDPYRFVWDVTPYVRAGKNTVAFTHLPLLAQGTTLVLRGIQVEIGEPIPSPNSTEAVKPAPEGPLPTYVARGRQPVAMRVALSSGGALRVEVDGRTLEIISRTSEPGGRWVNTSGGDWRSLDRGQSGQAQWAGTGYRVSRVVTVRDDHVHMADTLTNTSDQLVGVIYENRLDLSQHEEPKVLLGGRPPCSPNGSEEPGHPSAIALWKDLAVGLFAEDDIFRIHVRAFLDAEAIGLADPRLGIPPGPRDGTFVPDYKQSHTLEWSLYPVPQGDYWDVINAVRRNWGSNVTLLGPSLFNATDGSKPLEYFEDMVRSRRLKLVFSNQTAFIGDEIKNGVDLAEGTAIPLARRWCDSAAEWVRKLHAADPEVKTFLYLHPSICTEPGAETIYADSKVLDPNGVHVISPYRYPVYEYISSLDNSYGPALFKTLETIFEQINPDGIYMDEISGGSVPQYVYGTQWDGCTVNIDQQTHAVTGPYSSVVLLEQSWKSAMVQYLRERGKLLVGNGPATTRTMLGWQALLFTELNSYSFIINVHLCTPWALGNHDNENDDRVRARMVRKALDYAGAITVYSWGDQPEGLHYMHVMYPLTPVELRAGMIMGEERIVTNRSGWYGWPDGRAAEVYVFDGDGKPVEKPLVKEIREDGRLLTEVRMPGDHFAVLVRK